MNFQTKMRDLSRQEILFLFLLIRFSMASNVETGEQRLLQELGVFDSHRYDKSVRPVFNSSQSVSISFDFSLIQIMDMDEKNQILTTNAWLIHEWTDERISWNSSQYNGLKKIRIPASTLWLPDIVLYNNADDYTSGFMPINAMVEEDGAIFWSPPSRVRCACKVDITFFPFDIQKCQMKFGSWTYDKAQVDLVAKSDIVTVKEYTSNGEWLLKKYTIHRDEVKYPGVPEIYPDIKVTLVMQRRILYYVLNIIFPCFWLNVLSVLTFCLPPDAGEKITLSITVLLAYSVFMLLVAESMPPTSEFVPLIGIYLTLSMATASVSVVLTVLVLKFHHCSPKQTRVPKLVRVVVLKILAKLVRCSCREGVQSMKRVLVRRGRRKVVSNEDSESNSSFADAHEAKASRFDCLSSETDSSAKVRTNFYKDISTGDEANPLVSQNSPHYCKDDSTASKLDSILTCVRSIVMRNEVEELEEEVIDEWKQVAIVLDRLLFWIFLFVTLFSSVVILMVVPSVSYSQNEGI